MKKLIYIPRVFGDSRLDAILNIFHLSRTNQLTVSFKRTKEILPAGQAIIAALIDSIYEQGRAPQFLELKRKQKLSPLLPLLANISTRQSRYEPNELGFERDQTRVVCSNSVVVPGFLERFFNMPTRKVSEEEEFSVRLMINELTMNAVDHSGAERYYAYVGQVDRSLHFGVLDMGVSIAAKMRLKYQASNDLALLELAFKEGFGTRLTRIGGLGLSYFWEHCKLYNGRLAIYSGNAFFRYYFKNRKIQKGLLKSPLQGTWCFGRIPLDEN